MKSLIALAALTFSVSTFAACPDLSGTWKCPTDRHSSEMTIVQHDIPNGVHYDVTSPCHDAMAIDADGQPRTFTSDKGTATVTAQCTDDNMVHITVDAVSADQQHQVQEDLMVSLADANTLSTKGTIKLTHGDQTQDKTVDESCTRAEEQ